MSETVKNTEFYKTAWQCPVCGTYCGAGVDSCSGFVDTEPDDGEEDEVDCRHESVQAPGPQRATIAFVEQIVNEMWGQRLPLARIVAVAQKIEAVLPAAVPRRTPEER